MERVEHCQDDKELVEHGLDEGGPRQDDQGDGVNYQTYHAETDLKKLFSIYKAG